MGTKYHNPKTKKTCATKKEALAVAVKPAPKVTKPVSETAKLKLKESKESKDESK